MVELTVAYVTGGNVAIIQPLKVTNTHVIVDIHHLSCFSLLRFLAIGIRAQVLLFYQKCMHKLFIHLVLRNVLVEEVICFNLYMLNVNVFYSDEYIYQFLFTCFRILMLKLSTVIFFALIRCRKYITAACTL